MVIGRVPYSTSQQICLQKFQSHPFWPTNLKESDFTLPQIFPLYQHHENRLKSNYSSAYFHIFPPLRTHSLWNFINYHVNMIKCTCSVLYLQLRDENKFPLIVQFYVSDMRLLSTLLLSAKKERWVGGKDVAKHSWVGTNNPTIHIPRVCNESLITCCLTEKRLMLLSCLWPHPSIHFDFNFMIYSSCGKSSLSPKSS